MSDEFEDRENDALGELPSSIQRERNEFSQTAAEGVPRTIPPETPIGTLRPAGIPPDIQALDDTLNKGNAKLGSPVIPASVTSVYDARPVNARDWKQTETPTLLLAVGNPPPIQTITMEYTVPLGFVSVLRGFQFIPRIIPAIPLNATTSAYFDWVTVSILVNNIVQQDYNNLKFGPVMDKAQDTFVIANELQIITLKVTFAASFLDAQKLVGNFETTPVLLQMYGNNLLTRGLPTPFEIATQVKSGINIEDKK